MPSWLIQLLVTLAIKVGVPQIAKLFPNLPQEIRDIIDALIEALKDPKVSNSSARKQAISRIRTVAMDSEIKKDG